MPGSILVLSNLESPHICLTGVIFLSGDFYGSPGVPIGPCVLRGDLRRTVRRDLGRDLSGDLRSDLSSDLRSDLRSDLGSDLYGATQKAT